MNLALLTVLAVPLLVIALIFFRRLPREHSHSWQATRQNPFYITTEQRCTCGAARHLLEPSDYPLEGGPKWRDGRHPRSQK
jgi:hypothetical protein